jgi:hypothetical protein
VRLIRLHGRTAIYRNEVLIFLENTFCTALSPYIGARKLSAYKKDAFPVNFSSRLPFGLHLNLNI